VCRNNLLRLLWLTAPTGDALALLVGEVRMPNTIRQTDSGLTVAQLGLGVYASAVGSVRRQVHDGDTVSTRALGNFGVRFLGVDAPEISFRLGNRDFVSLADPAWETFLSDPFSAALPPINPPLDPGLMIELKKRCGPGAATNHRAHADAAENELERLIDADIQLLGTNKDDFRFFLAFANDVIDRYGRLLGYVHRDDPANRPLSYNEQMLKSGHVLPYFIWPNVNPYLEQPSLIDAVVKVNGAATEAALNGALTAARDSVRAARAAGIGVFAPANQLRLEAFELRYLAERRAPSRWVIDLRKDEDVLYKPMNYYLIPFPEDRLYVPEEYVPLFVDKGWKRQ
jgi:endonuclease YncB( thermonuclease family)